MHWTRQVTSFGEPNTVYELLADFERWPRLLPHVRETRLADRSTVPDAEVVRIGYERFGLYVPCTCRVTRDATLRRVDLLHVAGHAAGLRETWRAEPADDGTLLVYESRIVRRTTWLAAVLLVTPLAERTMNMIDLLAEADRSARSGPKPFASSNVDDL